jgi:pyridoxal phosphate enzyme (YggS family)
MIADNIRGVRERITKACVRCGRDPAKITLVAISKNRSAEEVEEVIQAGITDIGENKLQEARLKADSGNLKAVRWHMVGHLQSNKVKEAVKIFDLIHSVDSQELAQEIDKQAAKVNKVQDILIQVNTSGEESKFGLRPKQVAETISIMRGLKNIRIAGLMTIAPLVSDPEKVRLYFRALRELRDKIVELRITTYDLQLSMGMSDDFEVAIEEGADIVRIGRAIYE